MKRFIVSDGGKMPNMSLAQKKLIKATEAFEGKWRLMKPHDD
jgi:hypothetical protein